MAKDNKSIAVRAVQPMREDSRIAAVKAVFEKRGELSAFRKGAALRLKCLTVERFVQAWRKAGLAPSDEQEATTVAKTKRHHAEVGCFIFVAVFADTGAVSFGPYPSTAVAKRFGLGEAKKHCDENIEEVYLTRIVEIGSPATQVLWR